MKDKNYRLSAELCALKAEDADKLIAAGDGDAALLYIYLLRRGQLSGEGLPTHCRGGTGGAYRAGAGDGPYTPPISEYPADTHRNSKG